MQSSLGSGDYFVPMDVQEIWEVPVGSRQYFTGMGLRNNRIGGGGFGESFFVDGWLNGGLPSFPCSHRMYGITPNETRCCLKIVKLKESTETPKAYYDRAQLEYQELLEANGANGRVPRPLAFGKATVGGNAYWSIVMEYLPNGNGTYFLSDSNALRNDRIKCVPGSVTPLQTATFALQMGLALIDLHSCRGGLGIAHRDLYPDNVAVRVAPAGRGIPALPSNTGTIDRVYMVDLGNSTAIERLATPVLGGTHDPRGAQYQYGAPEIFDMFADHQVGETWQYRNKPTVDIWSMGALVYHFFTGEHPSLYDPSKSAPRDIAFLPKVGGLSIPAMKMDEFAGDPVALLIDDIVRRCTTFDPLERASRANLVDICRQLAESLGISCDSPDFAGILGAQPHRNTPSFGCEPDPLHLVAGPLALELPGSYELVHDDDGSFAYAHTDRQERHWRFSARWERGIRTPAQRSAYANVVAQRIDELFLHAGTVTGDGALGALGGAGATVRPGKGTDPAFCTISFTVDQADGTSCVMRLGLYFTDECAILLGTDCLCAKHAAHETRLLLEEEMDALVLTLARA